MQKPLQSKEVFIRCSCAGEGLLLTWWNDDNLVYISKLRQYPIRWSFRLKAAWDVLWHGDPYKDEVILHPEQREQLAEFLGQIDRLQ